jgi:hypothetical protein
MQEVMMDMKNLPPELKPYKEEFDFLHKKIGDLEWELATIYLGRKGVLQSEMDRIEEQLENYRSNIGILIDKVHDEVRKINCTKLK